MLGEIVYALCALTSLACAWLLWRGYRRSRARLLLWSSLCFIALAVNNVLLFVDLVILPRVDLLTLRTITGLAGLIILLYGLVWETE
jgi:hypothetical protein